MLLYLAIYVPGTLGGFFVLSYLSTDEKECSTLDELEVVERTFPEDIESVGEFIRLWLKKLQA